MDVVYLFINKATLSGLMPFLVIMRGVVFSWKVRISPITDVDEENCGS